MNTHQPQPTITIAISSQEDLDKISHMELNLLLSKEQLKKSLPGKVYSHSEPLLACQVTAQLDEMDTLRDAAKAMWVTLNQEYKDYSEKGEAGTASKMASKINTAFETIIKLDARIDQKRKMLLTMRQSLYLTPRARAGVAPKGKEEKPPEDDMSSLLNVGVEDDFTEQVDGETGGTA